MEGIFEKIGIDSGIVIIAILVAMLVLILIVLVLVARVRDITNKYMNFMRGEDGKSLEKSVERRFQEVGTVVRSQAAQSSRMQFVEAIQNRSLTRYGIVKYDAFDDVGGKLSFALAMLDRNDTGFVLNAIHSKENCYLYLKEVVKGESYIMLSHEEIEALRSAKKFGSEEEAILKYQLDKAVRSEKQSAKKLQEMKKPRRRTSPANGKWRSNGSGGTRHGSMVGTSDQKAARAATAAAMGGAAAAAAVSAAVNAANTEQSANAVSTNNEQFTETPAYTSSSGYENTAYAASPSYSVPVNAPVSGYASQQDYDTSAYTAQSSAYNASSYEAQPPTAYEAQSYEAQSSAAYDAQSYEAQTPTAYDAQSYEAQSSAAYNVPSYEDQPAASYVSSSYEVQSSAAYESPAYEPQPSASYETSSYEAQSSAAYEPSAYANPSSVSYGYEPGNPSSASEETAYREASAYVEKEAEFAGKGIRNDETPQLPEGAFVNKEVNHTEEPEGSSRKLSMRPGNRKGGQPPRRTKRNKNRKNNDRKDQGHAGH